MAIRINGKRVDGGRSGDDIENKQDKIVGEPGQFVVIGEDGKVTTRTLLIAEEATV